MQADFVQYEQHIRDTFNFGPATQDVLLAIQNSFGPDADQDEANLRAKVSL